MHSRVVKLLLEIICYMYVQRIRYTADKAACVMRETS